MEAMGGWNDDDDDDDDDDGDNLVGALLDIIAVLLELLLVGFSGSWCRRNRVQAYLAFTTASKMAAAFVFVFAFVISNGIVGIDDDGDDECSDVSWRRFKLVKCEQVARELLMGARRWQAEKAVEE